jgi:hypothetical protein
VNAPKGKFGNNVHHKLQHRCLLRGVGVFRHIGSGNRANIYAASGLCEIHHHKSDAECKHCYHLKIEKRFQTNFSDFAQIADRCDARNNRNKNYRRNHHFDKFDENVSKRLQRCCKLWCDNAKNDTDNHTSQNLKRKIGVPMAFYGCISDESGINNHYLVKFIVQKQAAHTAE